MVELLKANKVPAVTLAFWVAKIAATTLGETGGDAVSMSLEFRLSGGDRHFRGDLSRRPRAASERQTLSPRLLLVRDRRDHDGGHHDLRAISTARRGWAIRSPRCCCSAACSLRSDFGGSRPAAFRSPNISDRRTEIFYWVTILISNTLGTALGDYTSDSLDAGFVGGAAIFGGAIAVIATIYLLTKTSRTLLFWAAFVLTRPLGATLGDILTKPFVQGGLHLDRIESVVDACLVHGAVHRADEFAKAAAEGQMAH